MKNVENKVVIITGASSGIGEKTARLLVENGAKVVLSARRKEKLESICNELGDKAAYYVSDVSNQKDMEALVAYTKETFGRVDVLFANAGIMPVSSVSQLAVTDWDAMIDINIRGVLYALAAVMPEFVGQKEGQVIATSSVAGTKPIPGNAVYCGTKYFIKAFMESFRQEAIQEGTNIRSTVLYPGAIQTELLNSIHQDGMKEIVESVYEKVQIKPDAVANAVLYAISQPDSVDISDMIIRPSAEA